jgi:hypothetical protein
MRLTALVALALGLTRVGTAASGSDGPGTAAPAEGPLAADVTPVGNVGPAPPSASGPSKIHPGPSSPPPVAPPRPAPAPGGPPRRDDGDHGPVWHHGARPGWDAWGRTPWVGPYYPYYPSYPYPYPSYPYDPFYSPYAPSPTWVPEHWEWNGWVWVWRPGYWR